MLKRRRARPRQSSKQRGHILFVEPIQRAPQTVVVEHICADPFSQQMLDGFVFKVLGHQIQLTITEPKPIQDHCDGGCPHTHTATLVSCPFIKPLCCSCFSADSCHYSQMIQSFRLIFHFLCHFFALPRFFLPYWKSFFPSILLRNVGYSYEIEEEASK
jgi:hypothetical protein